MKIFIVALLIWGVETIAQEVAYPVAPLAKGNYWVYEDYYVDRWRRIQITDTAKYVDSIRYFEVEEMI